MKAKVLVKGKVKVLVKAELEVVKAVNVPGGGGR